MSPSALPATWELLVGMLAHELGRPLDPATATPDLALLDSGVLDSLTILRLVVLLEDRFAVRIGPEEVVLENFATPARLAHLVDSKRTAQGTRL